MKNEGRIIAKTYGSISDISDSKTEKLYKAGQDEYHVILWDAE
jgi:hypothetical protein